MDHLSSLDASFLHLETPETPMHVGTLLLVDVPKSRQDSYFDDFKEMISKRMHLAPIFTRKLAQMPFELADPVWIEDDDIDLDYHVRSLTLRRPGSMAQLETLVARLHSSLLDRSRPLWEIYVIEGLEDGRAAIYFKGHHAGIDGKAGTEMAKVMYDTTPEVREVRPPRRTQSTGRYQLGVAELMQAAASHTAQQYRKLAELLPSAAKSMVAAGNVLSHQTTKPGERPLALGTAPKTIFNDSITNQRSYTCLSLPFPELKALGKRVGGTVNTIVMTMCSIALRRFLKERGQLPKEGLIAAVPVSLRSAGDDSMNNQVSMVRVDLATDIDDLTERFKAIHASSEAGKAVVRELKPVLGVDMPLMGSPWLMTSMASLYGRSSLSRRLPPVASVCISNVPGPTQQLYVCGAAMTSYYPVSIPYHGMALNMTVQSYAGKVLDFGITSCRRVLSQEESHELIGYLKDALEEIKQLPSVDEAGAAPADAPALPPAKADGGKARARGTAAKTGGRARAVAKG